MIQIRVFEGSWGRASENQSVRGESLPGWSSDRPAVTGHAEPGCELVPALKR